MFSRENTKPVKITLLPYYGGARGQTLQIAEMPDGKVTTTIIKTPPNETSTIKQEAEPTTPITDVEYPPLPSKPENDYRTNLKSIHQNALNIIKLQEQQKTQGQLTETEQAVFKESVDSLNEASDNLARLQEHDDDDDGDDDYSDDSGGTLSAWFERKKNNKLNKDKKKEGEQKKEGEEKEEDEDGEDGIAINLPPEDASVAEAKPVGLAIAGECLLILLEGKETRKRKKRNYVPVFKVFFIFCKDKIIIEKRYKKE